MHHIGTYVAYHSSGFYWKYLVEKIFARFIFAHFSIYLQRKYLFLNLMILTVSRIYIYSIFHCTKLYLLLLSYDIYLKLSHYELIFFS